MTHNIERMRSNTQYSRAKAGGIRCVYSWMSVIGGSIYICAPAVAVIVNATRVVKSCKTIYVTIGYTIEAIEDASQVTFLPLDLVFFGQPVPANKEGRFSNWDNVVDIINNLPSIGDS